jgi:putrescine aminotransferase
MALAVLKAMQAEGVVERVREDLSPYFRQRWAELADHPIIGEARSVGLMGALEIVEDKAYGIRYPKELAAGMRARDFCVRNGLVMRAVGDTMIVSPPLISEHAHIDELVEKAWRCMDLTAKSLEV